jgi:hypothetical protein
MSPGYGGRRAAQPDAGWEPAEPLRCDGTSVLVTEELTGRQLILDCAIVDAAPEIQRWLARVIARQASSRSAIKRITSFSTYFRILRLFVQSLGGAGAGVAAPADITPWHVTAFMSRYESTKTQYGNIVAVRRFLRDDPDLPERTRSALKAIEVRKQAPLLAKSIYSDAEWQLIMTALRRDARVARDRIRSARELLDRYRAGECLSRADRTLAMPLDVFDRTGDIPRSRSGRQAWQAEACGGKAGVAARLCLTPNEMAAFALLLTAMTGENFGTVAAWPAIHYRPDGDSGTGPQLALIETDKPRRGPERQYMITPLEDLPAGLADLLSAPDTDEPLFRSPLKVYQLLLELAEVSRRHGGHDRAHSAYTSARRDGGSPWIATPGFKHVRRWAEASGFPTGPNVSDGGPPPVDVGRVRRTVTELRRRPRAHSRRTMRDVYLMPSPTVQAESRGVIAAALEDQVSRARKRLTVPVLGSDITGLLDSDPGQASERADLDHEVLRRLAAGEQDTGVAACIDHLAGRYGRPGEPCPASFLDCLQCPNARALPHQLPAQVLAAERILALRPHLDPELWAARYARHLAQLEDIVSAYTSAEREQARAGATEHHRRLVAELVEGHWDLR